MADAAGRENISVGAKATSITRQADGSWTVALESGETLHGDAVIVASEAWATAPLLSGVDDELAGLVASIPCSSSATILMGFDEADCPFDKHWHGILSPAIEHEPVTGISLMSSKWPDRAPEGRVLLRGFVGGPRDQEIVKRSDEELVEIARELLRAAAGREARGEAGVRARLPLDRRDAAVHDGAPRPRRRDRSAHSRDPGLALAGGAYRGVGVPNCLESGEKAVTKVLGEWGITLAEDTEAPKRLY